jgi:hypothetical protein
VPDVPVPLVPEVDEPVPLVPVAAEPVPLVPLVPLVPAEPLTGCRSLGDVGVRVEGVDVPEGEGLFVDVSRSQDRLNAPSKRPSADAKILFLVMDEEIGVEGTAGHRGEP